METATNSGQSKPSSLGRLAFLVAALRCTTSGFSSSMVSVSNCLRLLMWAYSASSKWFCARLTWHAWQGRFRPPPPGFHGIMPLVSSASENDAVRHLVTMQCWGANQLLVQVWAG